MPDRRKAWFERIRSVEREHAAARLAVDRLLVDVRRNPDLLGDDLEYRDLVTTSDNLEGTYLIRLFAEFEACLRLFWPTVRTTRPPSRTRDLLDGIASNRKVLVDPLGEAHAVREHRNSLVHLRDAVAEPVTIGEARHRLCRFLAYLPPEW